MVPGIYITFLPGGDYPPSVKSLQKNFFRGRELFDAFRCLIKCESRGRPVQLKQEFGGGRRIYLPQQFLVRAPAERRRRALAAGAGNTHIKEAAKFDTRKGRRDAVTRRPTTCKETVRQSLKTTQA